MTAKIGYVRRAQQKHQNDVASRKANLLGILLFH
jgi:hypothetical protein